MLILCIYKIPLQFSNEFLFIEVGCEIPNYQLRIWQLLLIVSYLLRLCDDCRISSFVVFESGAAIRSRHISNQSNKYHSVYVFHRSVTLKKIKAENLTIVIGMWYFYHSFYTLMISSVCKMCIIHIYYYIYQSSFDHFIC